MSEVILDRILVVLLVGGLAYCMHTLGRMRGYSEGMADAREIHNDKVTVVKDNAAALDAMRKRGESH